VHVDVSADLDELGKHGLDALLENRIAVLRGVKVSNEQEQEDGGSVHATITA
jgi:hypothetical protein